MFGAIPSPADNRDYNISMLTSVPTEFPEGFRIEYKGKKKNQKVSSCVPNSLSYVKEQKEEKEFSVGYIYTNRKDTDYQGEGMIPREALSNLLTDGDVEFDDYPYDEDYSVLKPTFPEYKVKLINKSKMHAITAYARLNTINDVKTALMKIGPVTVCYNIFDSFYNVGSDGMVSVPASTESKQGMHEMTIFGWENGRWIVLNSWGEDWGDKGYCYIPFEYEFVEAWSITDKEREGTSMYKDFDKVANWAKPYVEEANKLGIMNGDNEGNFNPKDEVTREQLAVALVNLYHAIKG